ncbi:MAG: acetyltransferase [Pseudomonadales bacterium]|nr:acetyltransferase [Pseudomonadales bacterium]
MADVIIFGTADTAQLANYYFKHDSHHNVVAFTVSRAYLKDTQFEGLPVVPFEDLENHYSPDKYQLFIPMTATGMNKDRESLYLNGKEKGYRYVSYISSHATILSDEIGENCFILEDNTIQPFVSIGDNVVLWSGNHIGHHSTIKSHNFFTSQVVLSGHCMVNSYCFFGVNSTIRDSTEIAEGSFIAMGACITKNTSAWSTYIGNPAKKHPKPSYEMYK